MKRFIFLVVIALIIIDGVYASHLNVLSGNFYTLNATTISLTCPDGTAACTFKYPGVNAYDAPVGTHGRHLVDLSEYSYQP